MRFKHKKLFISGTAVAAAGALGVGALFQTVLSVQASSEMMPGIEQIVSENTEEKPFRILELVNNSADAEIGYYISGQEPSLKLYEYQYTDSSGQTQTVHFSSVQDALSKLPTARRAEFIQNIRQNSDGSTSTDTGIKNISDISADKDGPLTYTGYAEKYFLDSDESGWTKVDLTDFSGNSRTDTVSVNGTYQENSSGTGNYTKEEQEYYPIRNGVQTDQKQTGKYRENIQNFHASESSDSRGAYYLEFAPVSNEKINAELEKDKGQTAILPEYDYANGRYGYYENVYTDLTEEIVNDINEQNYQFPGENPVGFSESDEVLIQNNEKEAVQSTIEKSNAFTSGEKNSTDDSEDPAEDSFSEDSESSSVDFDNAYQMEGEDVFASGDTEIPSTDADVSLELQSYETPVESSGDFDAEFSDDFTDETVDSGEQSVDADTEEPDNTVGFEGDNTEQDTAGVDMTEEGNAGTTDDTEGRKVLGGILNTATAGTQENPYIYLGETIAEYPYYQYELIGDLAYVKDKEIQTKNDIQRDPDKARETGDILLDNDQYWYYEQDDSGTIKRYPVSIVTGRQAVPFNELQEIPEDMEYDYYYRVEKVYFCCHAVDNQTENLSVCAYRGWYYPSYPENEEIYLPVTEGDGKTATHYISEASYSLTPGRGNYDFVPGGDTSCQVEVDHFYYQGGYVNNDWFKKDVFHLTPKASADEEDGEFEKFNITVDTRSADDATTMIYADPVIEDTTTGYNVGNAGADTDSTAVADSAGDVQDDFTSEDIEFSSEYQEPETTDTDETVDVATEENDSTDVADQENSDEESTDIEVTDETDSSIDVDVQTDETVAADVGDGETSGTSLADSLKEYDLIYINGDMQKETAETVLESGIPCIINAARVTDGSAVAKAFSTLIQSTEEDADGQYVNANVYFFKDTLAAGTADNSSLLNRNFATNFNNDKDSEEDKTYAASDKMHGFEEIVKYINSENQYRGLLNDSDVSADDSDSENTDTQSIEQLTREISQARVIEYIINYKYKRARNSKQNMLALQIMPDANDSQINYDTVENWLGIKKTETENVPIKSVTANCWHSSDKPANMLDGNKTTIWHSKWKGENSECSSHTHWFELTLREPSIVSGVNYTSRPNAATGTLIEYKAELMDENDNILYTTTGKTGLMATDYTRTVSLSFGKQVSGVKKIKISYLRSYENFASCAEISVFNDPNIATTTHVEVENMTASEFVGHIDDIGSEYDMIYISDKIANRNKYITGEGDYRYVHVGGGQKITGYGELVKLLGLLDTDYAQGTWSDGLKRFAPLSTYSENGSGYFRGSGNDITEQQYSELMNFVKSGYPVVLASGLVSNGKPNAKEVDSSSYYYQFISDALKYDNVFTKDELDSKTKDISFYMNLAKPVIDFTENGRPPEPQRQGETDASAAYINGELKYEFTVKNDSDAVPASTTYNCKLYLDLNFDGNLSDSESQDSYIVVQDEDGNVLSQQDYGNGDLRYELKNGKKYTVTRQIPQDYFKIITWKLELSNNRNPYVHTSETGYAKQKNTGEKQTINVLQLVPSYNANNPCRWNLAESTKFKQLMSGVEDFQLHLTTVDVSNVNNESIKINGKKVTLKELLDEQQMLIIGFQDVYQDISLDAVEEILSFIRSGKSVIFSHDTTSYINYDPSKVYEKIAKNAYDANGNADAGAIDRYKEGWLWSTAKNPTWGLSLNTILRSVVGMDRYGITSDAVIRNETVSALLKKGSPLSAKTTDFKTLMELAGDVAYKNGDKTQSYAQTQGYSNMYAEGKKVDNAHTNTITKVNDGAITQYPFRMGDTINSIATTHGQYYQLGLEQDRDINNISDGKNDIVVWYCLFGGVYGNSPNDVRNNYYLYSKGNVIYTGAGHSTINDDEEIKLFINAIVAAANVTAVQPQVNFVSALNPSAETEESRYYMTDQSSWATAGADGNTLEKDMQFYIDVRDYNMVSADLSNEDKKQQKMTVSFYIEDSNGTVVDGAPSGSTPISKVDGDIAQLTAYGSGDPVALSNDGFVIENNAYALTLHNVEKYLKAANGEYKQKCKLYAKVTSTVSLYGQLKTNTSWASIDLKQRQLFEMD